jgi:hypothetical protein
MAFSVTHVPQACAGRPRPSGDKLPISRQNALIRPWETWDAPQMLMCDHNTNFGNSAARLFQGSAAHRLSCYLIAVLSVAVAMLAAELATRLLHAEAIASLMLCAVISTAWFGGFGAALLAIGLALVSFHYYLAPPTGSFLWKQDLLAVGVGELPRLFCFPLYPFSLHLNFGAGRQQKRSTFGRAASSHRGQKRIEQKLRLRPIWRSSAFSPPSSWAWDVRLQEIFIDRPRCTSVWVRYKEVPIPTIVPGSYCSRTET